MDLGLAGTVAIVGGSSSGMGRATARTLAGEGCRVVLFARRAELLNEVAAAITAETGTEALAVPTDATNPAALDAVVDAALDRFGRLDIVVNNAGGPPAGGYEQLGDDDFQRAYELTLLSALRLTRRALPALRASGRGRIVNLTGSSVKEPNEGLLLSNVFRPGVIGWAKTISREEARHGITVNSIAPGSIATDRLVELYAKRARSRRRPAPRRGPDPRRPLRRPRGDRGRRGVSVLDRRGVHHRDDTARGRRTRPGFAQLMASGGTTGRSWRGRGCATSTRTTRARAATSSGRSTTWTSWRRSTGTRTSSARRSTSWMRRRRRSPAPRSIPSGPTRTSAWPWRSGSGSPRSASCRRTGLRP